MTLANTLHQKLNETPAATDRHELTVTDAAAGSTLHLTADRRDRWTTVAWELSVHRPSASGDVATWAEGVTQRVSGLLEPLAVVEVDNPRQKALVRSAKPTQRDGKLFYYEIIFEGTSSARVCRYEGHEAGKREQVPFALTNEVLVKFIGDLAAE